MPIAERVAQHAPELRAEGTRSLAVGSARFFEHEPVNFFGHSLSWVDIGAMSAKRSHSLIELRVRQTRQEESARSADFRTKLGQSGVTISVTISWCLGVKPAAARFDLISSLDGKSASNMARTAGKKFGTTTSFSRVPVRMQT